MKPSVLQTDWSNRVAFTSESRKDQGETFFVTASDPRHNRALWIRLHLSSQSGLATSSAWAAYFDGDGSLVSAAETWPIDRAGIDPERAGLGTDVCNVEDGNSQGTLAGDGVHIGWHLKWSSQCPAYRPLPAERLYRHSLVPLKSLAPVPCGVFSGTIDIWHGGPRGAQQKRIVVSQWRGVQSHNWGAGAGEPGAWVHCAAFDGASTGSYFEALQLPSPVLWLGPKTVTLGRLVLDGCTYRFDTLRSLLRTGSSCTERGWDLDLQGPDGRLRGALRSGRLTAEQNLAGGIQVLKNIPLSELTITLEPRNDAARTLNSGQAAFAYIVRKATIAGLA